MRFWVGRRGSDCGLGILCPSDLHITCAQCGASASKGHEWQGRGYFCDRACVFVFRGPVSKWCVSTQRDESGRSGGDSARFQLPQGDELRGCSGESKRNGAGQQKGAVCDAQASRC